MTKQLQTPIAFIIFNRPKCTRRVFEEIRKARPQKLYLIADAPRPHKKGEAEKCAETRQLVESMIDWPCEVKTNYAETNMGCGKRIPSGLDWVFEHEESAIILEDDILADPTFFLFCEAMLERYRGNEKIMQIVGYNRFNYAPAQGSYFYSRYGDIWGWASWRRAWNHFHDVDSQTAWRELCESGQFAAHCKSPDEATVCSFVLDQIFDGKLNTWAMRWQLARTVMDGWSINPSRNLTKNIGFGLDASHTINPINRHQLLRTRPLPLPYENPHTFACDAAFEKLYHRTVFQQNEAIETAKTTLLHLFKKIRG